MLKVLNTNKLKLIGEKYDEKLPFYTAYKNECNV